MQWTYSWDGLILFTSESRIIPSNSELISRFNSLAVLPLYTFDFSKYPSNTTVYTDALPYSTATINSGSFKVDDSKLQCVTDGQIVFRNAHEFDGSEYIKTVIDGIEYTGTGTVTEGSMTASIEQGSTLITIDMTAGDALDAMDIQLGRSYTLYIRI